MSILHTCLLSLLISAAPQPANKTKEQPAKQAEKKYSPELEKILNTWGEKLSQIQSAEVRFNSFAYDNVFWTEKRGEGHVTFTRPNRLRIQFNKTEIPKSEKSKRRTRDGKHYELQPEKPITWTVDGKNLLGTIGKGKSEVIGVVDSKRPRYLRLKSFSFFGEGKLTEPAILLQEFFPIFIGLDSAELRRLYTWELSKESPTEYHLSAKSRTRHWLTSARKMNVIVSKTTFLPTAVQHLRMAGRGKTVYSYSQWKTMTKPKQKKP